MQIVPYQEELRPALPTVIGNVDYQEFRATLLRIEEILDRSGLEREFIRERQDQYRKQAESVGGRSPSAKELHLSGNLLLRYAVAICYRKTFS